jgi:hypothetical protein
MTQEHAINLSVEDAQMIDRSQIGAPLAIYGLRHMVIRLYYWMSIFFFFMSSAILLIIMLGSLKLWYDHLKGSSGSVPEYVQFLFSGNFFTFATFDALFGCLGAQGVAWMVRLIIIPQARYERIIVCEEGLLYLTWRIRKQRVRVLRWTDIWKITKNRIFPGYELFYTQALSPKTLSLSWYEDRDELAAWMRQKKHESFT